MKTFIIILALLSAPAFAGEMILSENYSITIDLANSATPDTSFLPQLEPAFIYVDPNGWSTLNTVLAVTFQVLNIIDWGQTRYVAKNPKLYQESEAAWLIGEHPSTTDVDLFMIVSAILQPVISYYLPHGWREWHQSLSIGSKLNATIGNASIGIKFQF